MGGRHPALSSEHVRRLWLANIVTVVGAQLTVVAVPAQIYEITGSSAYVGLTGFFGLVPLVVFGLYGGALADVMDRRTPAGVLRRQPAWVWPTGTPGSSCGPRC